ncbi:MAG: amidase family protein [Caulobacterales bacterium]
MSDILSLDATAQLGALETRRISALELLEASVCRRDKVNPLINAVVAVDLERARHWAKAIDELRVKGDLIGALAGLPMTIKDTLDVEGMPASSGLDEFRHRRAKDAVVVAHARHAGAVIWGKTNVPVMAGDWQSYNAIYGTSSNPWDLDRTTGGSSGGAAAALATGITALEIGSDIGGSLRVPASFCGVYSHKPTWGFVSQVGHVPPRPGSHAERDLNVVGPMARSARDLRLLLSVLEHGPMAAKAQPLDLEGLRVGLWLDEPAFALDPEVRATVESFAEELAKEGAVVTALRAPVDAPALLAAYQTLLASTLAEDLPAGQRRTFELLRGPAKLARAMGAPPDSWAGMALNYTARYSEWAHANETRARLAHQMRGVFERLDTIIAPIAPVTAFVHDHRPFAQRTLHGSDGAKLPYLAMIRWIALATACGLPATAIPAGQAASGLPVGVQLIGPRGSDSRMIAIAEAIEARLGGFTSPPKHDDL